MGIVYGLVVRKTAVLSKLYASCPEIKSPSTLGSPSTHSLHLLSFLHHLVIVLTKHSCLFSLRINLEIETKDKSYKCDINNRVHTVTT